MTNTTDARWMARKRAQNRMVQERRTDAHSWTCCDLSLPEASSMYRHVADAHAAELDQQTDSELQKQSARSLEKQERQVKVDAEFKARRAEKYASDPISMDCTCDPAKGTVILFYAYLPIPEPSALAVQHRAWSQDLGLCGKVKLAHEGINATLAGSVASITQYIDQISDLPEFESLQLSRHSSSVHSGPESLNRRRYNFFKPTPGCIHVFGGTMSIKVVDEICPLGAPEMSVYQDPLNKTGKLPPAEFHAKLKELQHQEDVVVLDVRNYYESSIGHFPGAVMPPIRKFSSFRDYIDRNRDQFAGKTILSYCTGGIRCEKATTYLRQSLEAVEGSKPPNVLMLEGGIHNYLEWIKQENDPKESLWLGKNYVFDARQSLGLAGSQSRPDSDQLVSFCQGCKVACARYVKCDGFGCHRLIIACENCSPTIPSGQRGMCCCEDCKEMGERVLEYVGSAILPAPGETRVKRGICSCERARRIALGVEEK